MTLFDSYVVVDWSAAGRPATGADSIWIAAGYDASDIVIVNPSTRMAAADVLDRVLADGLDRRTLLAIDVALGYPVGSAGQFGLDGTPWRAMWAEIARLVTDDRRNRNNRFEAAALLNERVQREGPFWGRPCSQPIAHLRSTKPRAAATVAEYRITERRLREAGWQPKSVWQLLGAGSVGSQTLTALPALQRLLVAQPDRIEVWPFTTGAMRPATEAGSVVVAEIWPSRFELGADTSRVRDARQVDATVRALRDADRSGELGEWFRPELDDAERVFVEAEEGWVLGPPVTGPVLVGAYERQNQVEQDLFAVFPERDRQRLARDLAELMTRDVDDE